MIDGTPALVDLLVDEVISSSSKCSDSTPLFRVISIFVDKIGNDEPFIRWKHHWDRRPSFHPL